jgi:hypothetical protein
LSILIQMSEQPATRPGGLHPSGLVLSAGILPFPGQQRHSFSHDRASETTIN